MPRWSGGAADADTVASVLEYYRRRGRHPAGHIVAKVSGTLEQVNVSLAAWARRAMCWP